MTIVRTIIATSAAALSVVALSAPATAAQPSDLSDVRFMTAMAKAAWMDVDRETRSNICAWFYVEPYAARNEMARGFYEDVFEYEFSLYDAKRAAWRVLNWGC